MKRRARTHGRIQLALWLVAVTVASGCGDQARSDRPAPASGAGPIHVHGLGVNPADGALFVATHTGMFRAAPGELRATRVGGRYQDTMGFVVVGPDRFLGSGHPDLRDRLPPFLGLIETRDAGRSWKPLSLLGKVDFHVLEADDASIYGYGSDFRTGDARFLKSRDGGRSWRRLDAPEPLISLALSPTSTSDLIASGQRRLLRSKDGGRSWTAVHGPAVGLLAWNRSGVFLADRDGRVWRSSSFAAPWQAVSSIGGPPAAFDNGRGRELLAALHDGTVKRSIDDAASWSIRSAPR